MATLKTEKDIFYGFIIDKLDSSNYFRLKNSITGRTELFNFAIALGIDKGPKQIEHKNDLIRLEYTDNVRYIYNSIYLHGRGQIDEEASYKLAEEYANAGFYELKDCYDKYSEENFMLRLTKEINEAEDEITSFIQSLGIIDV